MATLHDLARRGALPILAALAREEPLRMREFTYQSGLVPDRARVLREELALLGILGVEKGEAKGAAEPMVIRLTPLGRELAKRALEMAEILERHSKQEAKA